MGKSKPLPVRLEHGKMALADHLYELYNDILVCPGCEANGSGGAFNKSTAGNANSYGERYRRFVCRKKLDVEPYRCPKTLSTSNFIELCMSHPLIGKDEVRIAQDQLISSDIKGIYLFKE